MAQRINRLSARKVAPLRGPGLYADGAGLYLRISQGRHAGRRWVFIYRRPRDSKRCEIGLGSALTVSLAAAHTAAAEARARLADGLHPRATKSADQAGTTFGEVADRFVETMEPRWRNTKHRDQWRMTLNDYAEPLRRIPVDQVTTKDVLGVLQPIWNRIPETASRLRGRIEAVLDAAQAQGLRTGPNPAAWKGNLKFVLPPPPKITRGDRIAQSQFTHELGHVIDRHGGRFYGPMWQRLPKWLRHRILLSGSATVEPDLTTCHPVCFVPSPTSTSHSVILILTSTSYWAAACQFESADQWSKLHSES